MKLLLWRSISDEGFQGRWPNNENCDADESEYKAVANIPTLTELKSCSLRDRADPALVVPLLIGEIEEESKAGENQEILARPISPQPPASKSYRLPRVRLDAVFVWTQAESYGVNVIYDFVPCKTRGCPNPST